MKFLKAYTWEVHPTEIIPGATLSQKPVQYVDAEGTGEGRKTWAGRSKNTL